MKVKFNLNRQYKLIPEGNQILTITDAVAVPSGAPTEFKITYTDVNGTTFIDKCNFTTTVWKLSRVCEAVFGIKDGEEMEISEIIKGIKGKQLECEVVHTKGNQPREDGTYPTFVNIKNIIGVVDLDESALPANMTPTTNPRDSILAGL